MPNLPLRVGFSWVIDEFGEIGKLLDIDADREVISEVIDFKLMQITQVT